MGLHSNSQYFIIVSGRVTELHPSWDVEDDHLARCPDCRGTGCSDCGYSGEGFGWTIFSSRAAAHEQLQKELAWTALWRHDEMIRSQVAGYIDGEG